MNDALRVGIEPYLYFGCSASSKFHRLNLPFHFSGSNNFTPNEDGLGMLMSMGFTRDQATLALKETSNNLERAADWIFSHQHELDSLVAAQSGAAAVPPPQKPTYTDGPPKYVDSLVTVSYESESL